MGAATTAAPYGFWATNPTKKLAHWVYLLGQPLSRNRVFQNFSGEPPLNELLPLSTSSRRNSLLKVQMNTNLSVTQHNFIYKAAQVWNKIIPKILNSPELDIGSGVVIPGFSVNSDLTTPIPFIKNRVKKLLYEIQRQGDTVQWLSDGSNFSV